MLGVIGIALAVPVALIALFLLLAALPLYSNETPSDVADAIERFLFEGREASRDYDEFLSIRARDPEVNALKQRLREIDDAHVIQSPPHYLSEAGLQELSEVAHELRANAT